MAAYFQFLTHDLTKKACGEEDVIKAYLLKCCFKALSYSGENYDLGDNNVLESTIYNMKTNPNP